MTARTDKKSIVVEVTIPSKRSTQSDSKPSKSQKVAEEPLEVANDASDATKTDQVLEEQINVVKSKVDEAVEVAADKAVEEIEKVVDTSKEDTPTTQEVEATEEIVDAVVEEVVEKVKVAVEDSVAAIEKNE